MHRRTLLSSIAAATVVGVAGCSGEENTGADNDETPTPSATPAPTSTPTPSVTPVSVTAESPKMETAVYTLTLRYATAAVTEIKPPDSYATSPDSGNKFVVLHSQVSVEGEIDEQLDVYGSAVALQADGVVYESRSIQDMPELTQTVLPGATYDAWVRFEVPEDVTEATLTTVDKSAWFEYPTKVVFEADESMSASIPKDGADG